jgi:hypothetical protein
MPKMSPTQRTRRKTIKTKGHVQNCANPRDVPSIMCKTRDEKAHPCTACTLLPPIPLAEKNEPKNVQTRTSATYTLRTPRSQSATSRSRRLGPWGPCRRRVRAPFRPPILRSRCRRRRNRSGPRWCPWGPGHPWRGWPAGAPPGSALHKLRKSVPNRLDCTSATARD